MAEGYKDFVAGDVLTAAQVDDYLMGQSVMRFASAAARNTALSGVLTEGLVSYLKDINEFQMYTGSAWIAAFRIGAYTAYTPTMFQEDGTGQTLTVGMARWTQQGLTISGTNHLTISAAGSATNGEPIVVSMPVAPFDTTTLLEYVGVGSILDSSTSTSYPVRVINYGGVFHFIRGDQAALNHVGVDPGFALAAGDVVSFNFQYEAAA